ncbi:MAG: PIN domain-containing protein [Armatimonadota bacterium]
MRVLLDTNVVVDVLLHRTPQDDAAARVLALVDRGRLEASVCATTVTTIYYLVARHRGREHANDCVRGILARLTIAPVDRAVLDSALALKLADYEDAVLHEAARASGAEAIVTRNPKHFGRAGLAVLNPQQLLSAVRGAGS